MNTSRRLSSGLASAATHFSRSLLFLLLVGMGCSPAWADTLRTYGFQGLGLWEPSPGSHLATAANAISDDGRAIVGQGHDNAALRWTAGSGWESVAGGFGSHATDVSADGSVVVGVGVFAGADPTTQAFRWTESTGTAQPLGTLPEEPGFGAYFSNAQGVSRDGRIAAGYSQSAFAYDAQSAQMSALERHTPATFGDFAGNTAYDVATAGDDYWSVGTTVFLGSGSAARRGVVWKNDELFTEFGDFGEVIAVTTVEGMPVVVQNAASGLVDFFPLRSTLLDEATNTWQDEILLHPPLHLQNFFARDISTDGNVIVGNSDTLSDSATIWEHNGEVWGRTGGNDVDIVGEIGGQLLKDLLTEGLSSQLQTDLEFANWQLNRATGVTVFEEDGIITSIIVGNGINPLGQHEAWMATVTIVPEPSSWVMAFSGVALLLLIAFRRTSATG